MRHSAVNGDREPNIIQSPINLQDITNDGGKGYVPQTATDWVTAVTVPREPIRVRLHIVHLVTAMPPSSMPYTSIL